MSRTQIDPLVALKGTTTNDSATTGYIGEYIESVVTGGTNAAGSTQFKDLTSITLSAGDWDVTANVNWNSNGATWTQATSGIGLVTGNDFSDDNQINKSDDSWSSSSTTPLRISHTIASRRLSLSTSTPVYLKISATYSLGTPQARGSIHARRVR